MPDGDRFIEAWGTYDLANYGDLLFPLIVDNAIASRVQATLRLASPHGGTYPAAPTRDVRRITPFADPDFFGQLDGVDGFVLGGGDIVRVDAFPTGSLIELPADHPDRYRPYRNSRFLIELGALARYRPVVWNAVGVPMAFDEPLAEVVRRAVEPVRYLSVRDQMSRHHLEMAGVEAEITVVPDSAFALADIFPSDARDAALERLRRRASYPSSGPTLAVQWSFADADFDSLAVAALRALLASRTDLQIVLVPLGRCHGDLARMEPLCWELPRTTVVSGAFALDELAAAIAGADAFVGSSMHGNITAAVFGVPTAFLALPTHRPDKLMGQARSIGRTDVTIDQPGRIVEVAEALLDGHWPIHGDLVARLVADVHAHFDACVAALDGAPRGSALPPIDEHRRWAQYGDLDLAATELSDRMLLRHISGLEENVATALDQPPVPDVDEPPEEIAAQPVPQPVPEPAITVERSEPPVTVVIPVYNGRRFLHDTVKSIVDQTRPPLEVIIVDDESGDGGVETVADISAPFPIHVVRQEHAGQSAARNRGVREARGEFIAFLDQDDLWDREHLDELCRPLEEDAGISWVFSDFDEIDLDGRTVTRAFLRETAIAHPKGSLAAILAGDLMVIPSASVIRRTAFESLGGFDEGLQGFEDDDLFLRAFRLGVRTEFVNRSLTRFRVHPTSSSANGVFAPSRRFFSAKIGETVADDRRLNRYYMRDVVAPRFFLAALDDYVRAVSERDWATARRLVADVKHFAALHHDRRALKWKVRMIGGPRRCRFLLGLNERLPRRLRPTSSPIVRLR